MNNVYIVTAFQDDIERTFLCSMVMLSPDGLYLVSQDGNEYRFAAADLIGIESVRTQDSVTERWHRR